MELSKTGKVDYKVFTTADLTRLIDFFTQSKEELADDDCRLEIVVNYEGGYVYQGDVAIDVLDETKLMKSFEIRLSSFKFDKRLWLRIDAREGSFTVSATDKNWVHSSFVQLEELLELAPSQNYWMSNFERQSVISSGLGLFIAAIVAFGFWKTLYELGPTGHFFFLVVILVSGQMIMSAVLKRMLFKWFPIIEFETTLEHINKNKKAKALWMSAITVVIIPVGISLIFRLI